MASATEIAPTQAAKAPRKTAPKCIDLDGNEWGNSEAKLQLEDDLLSGLVPLYSGARSDKVPVGAATMMPKDVYNIPGRRFQEFPYENFRTNLNALRKAYAKQRVYSIADAEALARDRILHPKPTVGRDGKPIWHGHLAEELLKEDIDNELHEIFSLHGFWSSRADYKEFDKMCFYNHILQELRLRKLYALRDSMKKKVKVEKK